jgi:outer membrane lipoprotein LolB
MRRVAPLLMAAVLAGCAATPRVASVTGAAIDPLQVTDWTATGRLAIAVGSEGGSGSFTWLQHGGTTDLQVRGPLGAGSMRIVTDGRAVSVTDAGGHSVDTEAARGRIRARLGAELPLAEMRYWMLGLAAPGSVAQVRANEVGASRVIEQAGWTVSCDPFTTVQGWSVPARLTAASGAARIKVVVDDWGLPAPGQTKPGAAEP